MVCLSLLAPAHPNLRQKPTGCTSPWSCLKNLQLPSDRVVLFLQEDVTGLLESEHIWILGAGAISLFFPDRKSQAIFALFVLLMAGQPHQEAVFFH